MTTDSSKHEMTTTSKFQVYAFGRDTPILGLVSEASISQVNQTAKYVFDGTDKQGACGYVHVPEGYANFVRSAFWHFVFVNPIAAGRDVPRHMAWRRVIHGSVRATHVALARHEAIAANPEKYAEELQMMNGAVTYMRAAYMAQDIARRIKASDPTSVRSAVDAAHLEKMRAAHVKDPEGVLKSNYAQMDHKGNPLQSYLQAYVSLSNPPIQVVVDHELQSRLGSIMAFTDTEKSRLTVWIRVNGLTHGHWCNNSLLPGQGFACEACDRRNTPVQPTAATATAQQAEQLKAVVTASKDDSLAALMSSLSVPTVTKQVDVVKLAANGHVAPTKEKTATTTNPPFLTKVKPVIPVDKEDDDDDDPAHTEAVLKTVTDAMETATTTTKAATETAPAKKRTRIPEDDTADGGENTKTPPPAKSKMRTKPKTGGAIPKKQKSAESAAPPTASGVD